MYRASYSGKGLGEKRNEGSTHVEEKKKGGGVKELHRANEGGAGSARKATAYGSWGSVGKLRWRNCEGRARGENPCKFSPQIKEKGEKGPKKYTRLREAKTKEESRIS